MAAQGLKAGNNLESLNSFFADVSGLKQFRCQPNFVTNNYPLQARNLKDKNITQENIYDVIKTGVFMEFTLYSKVITIINHLRNGDGVLLPLDQIYLLLSSEVIPADDNRKLAAVIKCICANGTALPPTIIYKGEEF